MEDEVAETRGTRGCVRMREDAFLGGFLRRKTPYNPQRIKKIGT